MRDGMGVLMPMQQKIDALSSQFPASCCCCISHEFYKAASKNPEKIAVIHAFGGARRARSSRKDIPYDDANDLPIQEASSSSSLYLPPPVYDGDQCFTYSDLLSMVDSLSVRLRNVLNGGDDPLLIRPTSTCSGYLHMQHSIHVKTSQPLKAVGDKSGNDQISQIPKIVGVHMVPSVNYIVAILSVLRCGVAFMPLDPLWPKERILSVISLTSIDLIVGCKYSDQMGSRLDHSQWLTDYCNCPVLFLSVNEILEQQSHLSHLSWPCETKNPEMFSYLMYTSGSTGKPKVVCGTEEGLLNRFLWMQELHPLLDGDIMLFKTSTSFIDHLQEFLAAMLTASTLVIVPFIELKSNLIFLIDFLRDYNISRLTAVPSLLRAILPALESPYLTRVQSSLKLLILSGEVLPVSLWHIISRLLPKTSILNIYGSTEVSGDCTYFDCKRLPMLLESEILSTVPIGISISNCNVVLLKEDDRSDEGEICVNGLCLSRGYICERKLVPLDYVALSEESFSANSCRSSLYFKTGDFARQLSDGDLVFLGRKDRIVKVNGKRISLEEIEDTLRRYPDVADAAVVLKNDQGALSFLTAVLVLEKKYGSPEMLRSLRSWMIDQLPSAMIPREVTFVDALPMSSTGKVNYALLSSPSPMLHNLRETSLQGIEVLEYIQKAFSDALAVAEVGSDDDFFVLGGDSISAAHAAHNLGVDMRLLYLFPSPSKLHKALLSEENFFDVDHQVDWETGAKAKKRKLLHFPDSESMDLVGFKDGRVGEAANYHGSNKHFKVETDLVLTSKAATSLDSYPWKSKLERMACVVSRCNDVQFMKGNDLFAEPLLIEGPRNRSETLRKLWKVHMEACVDASPVIAFKGEEILLFIGSHSHKFLCVNARSGCVQWEVKLRGRIESSCILDGDFSQVVVGCYQGSIYFIDMEGNILWTFQTCGEVKSQPVVDKCRHLIWCGSHDHNLYGLDYKNHVCLHQFACGGSIFGSPTIDKVRNVLYVGTTSGRLIAKSLQFVRVIRCIRLPELQLWKPTDFLEMICMATSFSTLWLLDFEAPIFGSLAISSTGNVICCLVNGHVMAVNYAGSVLWRVRTSGPIFGGACLSNALLSQALVCCRDGKLYSFDVETGTIVWDYDIGDPITASAFVDEAIMLASDASQPLDRLVCICSSSGRIHLLRTAVISGGADHSERRVQKFAELDLEGEIFSSPIMIGGRIFVGCRDDYLYCIVAEVTMMDSSDISDHK